jgi:hypothetical protein
LLRKRASTVQRVHNQLTCGKLPCRKRELHDVKSALGLRAERVTVQVVQLPMVVKIHSMVTSISLSLLLQRVGHEWLLVLLPLSQTLLPPPPKAAPPEPPSYKCNRHAPPSP